MTKIELTIVAIVVILFLVAGSALGFVVGVEVGKARIVSLVCDNHYTLSCQGN